jgi:hypothetical protein
LLGREFSPKAEPKAKPEKPKAKPEKQPTQTEISAQRILYQYESYGWHFEPDGAGIRRKKLRDDAIDPPDEIPKFAQAHHSAIVRLIHLRHHQRE